VTSTDATVREVGDLDPSPPPPPGPSRPGRGRALAFTAGVAALCALVFWLAHESLVDDAYITLAYARNVAVDLHWGLTPQQVSNTATAPGNVLLLAAVTALTDLFGDVRPVLALGIVCVLCGAAIGWGWARVGHALRLPWWAGAAGAALVVLNPFLVSALGLEVLPTAAVLVLLLTAAVEQHRRYGPLAFGLLGGLAVLIRPDLVVFVGVLALFTPAVLRKLYVAVPAALLVGAPWYVWSWFHFGSAVPDTFVIKTLQRSFDGVNFANGPFVMFADRPWLVLVAFVPAVLGAVLTLVCVLAAPLRLPRLRGTAAPIGLGVGAALYYAAYCVLTVPPYHWYYVPPMIGLTTAGAALAGRLAARADGTPTRAVAVPFAGAAGVLVAATVALLGMQGAPWVTPPVFGNWAVTPDYARAGVAIGERVGDDVVRNPGEIGVLAYFCRCAMVNDFTDRGVIVPLVQQRIDRAGPILRPLLELNYRNLDRTRLPLQARYELRYEPGPGAGPDVWSVWAPGRGDGHLRLVPLD
jgi:hypothetical protein